MADQRPAIVEHEDPLIEIPDRSVIDYLVRFAEERADHPFLQYIARDDAGDENYSEFTYGEFYEYTQRVAAELHVHGVDAGSSVAILMRNSPEWLATFFAVIGMGAQAVPVNYDFTAEEAEFYVQHADVEVLVASSSLRHTAEEVRERCKQLRTVLILDNVDLDRHRGIDVELGANVDADDVCLVMYTSGTSTGQPKGVMLTHKNLYIGPAEFSRVLGIEPSDRVLYVTPLFHANALQFATMAGLIHGATIQTVERFSASRFWADVDRLEPTVLWTMGGILSILMSRPETELEREARQHIRVVFGAGVANMFRAAQERITSDIMDCYGLTETSGGTYTPLDGSHVIDPVTPAVGLPLRHMKIGIMDDDDELLGYDEVGEIVFEVHNGNIMAGYLGNPEAQAEAIRDGWFHSGDMGFISEEDGFLHFVDRKKDIVRRAGENISSQEVEGVLRDHPQVGDCAVVPAPDEVLGEVVMAYVTPVDEQLDVENLREFCAERLAKQKIPEIIEVRDQLPRTPTGKIEKFALRKAAREQSDTEWRPM